MGIDSVSALLPFDLLCTFLLFRCVQGRYIVERRIEDHARRERHVDPFLPAADPGGVSILQTRTVRVIAVCGRDRNGGRLGKVLWAVLRSVW